MKNVVTMVMVFVLAIFIGGGKASAESWAVVNEEDGIATYIDTDSIRRGTESKKFPQFNRTDGFSAVIKISVQMDDKDKFEMINLLSFYEKDGKKMYRLLDSALADGEPKNAKDVGEYDVEKDGTIWIEVWNKIQATLK